MLSTTTASLHRSIQCRILRSTMSGSTSPSISSSSPSSSPCIIRNKVTTLHTTISKSSSRNCSIISWNTNDKTTSTTILESTISNNRRSLSSTNTVSENTKDNRQDLFVWGKGLNDSLLQVNQSSTSTDEKNDTSSITVQVPTLMNTDGLLNISNNNKSGIKSIICGKEYGETAIVYNDGKCYVCGPNTDGKLGVGHTNPVPYFTEVTVPSEDPISIGISTVVFGDNYTAYIDTIGDLYTCGSSTSSTSTSSKSIGSLYRLGHGPTTIVNGGTIYPTLVSTLVEDGCSVQKVILGIDHMTVLTTTGEILTVGCSLYGKLGNSSDTDDHIYLHPVEVLTGRDNTDTDNVTIDTASIIDISGGYEHTIALTKGGTVYGWGRAHRGQLGTFFGMMIDNDAKQTIPEPINSDDMITKHIIQISTGPYHSLCLSQSGEVYTWGSMSTINTTTTSATTTTATTENSSTTTTADATTTATTTKSKDETDKNSDNNTILPIQPQQNEPTPVYDIANVKMISIYDSADGISYVGDENNNIYTIGYYESKGRFGGMKKTLQVSKLPFNISSVSSVSSVSKEQEQPEPEQQPVPEQQQKQQFTFQSMSIGTNHASATIKYK